MSQKKKAHPETVSQGNIKASIPRFYVTEIESNHPLSKKFSVNAAGKAVKESLADLSEGDFRKVSFGSLEEFSEYLSALTPKHALTYGFFEGAEFGEVVSERKKRETPEKYASARTRTRNNMCWNNLPGILFLDYDPAPNGEVLTRENLISAIKGACPFLADCPMLWRPSASSFIDDTITGACVRGLMGQHIYIPVNQTCDIPALGKHIVDRLWLAGYGRFDISKSGAMLERTIVDTAVWTPERLDFVGGCVAVVPLKQKKLLGAVIAGETLLTLGMTTPLDPHETCLLKNLKTESRRTAEPESRRRKTEFIEKRGAEIAGPTATAERLDAVKRVVAHAVDGKTLLGDFVLLTQFGDQVTVKQLLENPEKWHNEKFGDPLEPDYNNDRRIAWANLKAQRPYIQSFAHGGQRYRLKLNIPSLRLEQGEKHHLVDRILEVLRQEGDLFEDSGGQTLFRVTGAERFPVSVSWLADKISRVISIERYDRRTNKATPADLPKVVCETILAKSGERGFPELKAICTAPTITPNGRIINTPGYDQDECLLFVGEEDWPVVPRKPTLTQVKEAFRELWKPFEKFPVTDAVNRGVFLAAVLTAMTRPCLPMAPGFIFDAPSAGSGKTLAARCLGILANGAEPDVSAPFGEEGEAKKRIFSALLKGSGTIIFDNVVGKIESATLNAILTSPSYTDRVLGMSQDATVSARTLWIFTGNNVRVVSDLNRRLFPVRLDPQIEAKEVWKRQFALAPADYCRRHRLALVNAGLTILAGFFDAGAPKLTRGSLASFEAWSDVVRNAVAWLGSLCIADVDDPVKALDRQVDLDPDAAKLESVLDAWFTAYGDKPVSISVVMRDIDTIVGPGLHKYSDLSETLSTVAGDNRGNINTRMLGRWIEAHQGRIINGKSFVRAQKRTDGVAWWHIKEWVNGSQWVISKLDRKECNLKDIGLKQTHSIPLTHSETLKNDRTEF